MRNARLAAVLLLIVGIMSVVDASGRLPGRWWQLAAGVVAVAMGIFRLARPRPGAPAA